MARGSRSIPLHTKKSPCSSCSEQGDLVLSQAQTWLKLAPKFNHAFLSGWILSVVHQRYFLDNALVTGQINYASLASQKY